MQNGPDAIERFKHSIAPFLTTWQSVDLRAILDLSEGQILTLVAVLSPEEPRPLEDIHPVVRDILFTRGALPITELDSLLDGWANGVVEIETRAFTTAAFSEREYIELASPWDDARSAWPDLAEYHLLLLHAVGPEIRELTQSRNLEAIGRAWGFRNFAEMSHHRVQLIVGESRRPRMEVFAPLLATVDAALEGSELTFRMSVHSAMQADNIDISYRLQDEKGARIAGDRLPLSQFSPIQAGYFNNLQHRLQVPKEVWSGEVCLYHSRYRLGEEPLVAKRFTVPPVAGETNPRWNLLMSLVRNTRSFMGKRTDPKEVVEEEWLGLGLKRIDEPHLCRGVSCLLFAAGLIKLSIGSETEGVDEAVQVTEPDRIAVLLSYSTGPDIRGKVSKLHLQVSRLREELQDYSVHGVIVAPLDRGDLLVRDVEDCESENITLVLRPELTQMLQAVSGRDWPRTRQTIIQILTRGSSTGFLL